MIIGAAGHIDHGKTSLVKSITGVDADRLKEEKERGITIDLGFAYWPQDDGFVIGFVDVPGHERLVHTMLAGAQGIDLVMLVVAADDGVMQQTREHLEIIELLGLGRAVVALTKIDAVGQTRIVEVEAEIAALLAPTRLANSPIFPLSNLTRAGVPALEAHLRLCAKTLVARAAGGNFRLAIDRSFILHGAGVVVTGMALDGVVRVGDDVVVSPSGLTARVRSVHAQNRKADRGRGGERCALNLIGPDIAKDAIRRGDMLLAPASHAPTRRIDAELTISGSLKKGLTQWTPARLHHATAEVGARIVLLDEASSAPGGSTRVQLVLDQPIAARARDRFVLRDVSARSTIGGGQFIDLRPPDRKRRTPERKALLDALAIDDPSDALAACLARPSGLVDLDIFARDRGAPLEEAEVWLEIADGVDIRAQGVRYGVGRARLAEIKETAMSHLAAYHAANPDRSGLGREALRMKCAATTPAPLFREILGGFVDEGSLAIDGNWTRLASHKVTISLADEKLWSEIAPMLAGKSRFRPPRVRDIGKTTGQGEDKLRPLFKRLARRGDIDEVAHDHYFTRATVAEMVRLARQTQGDDDWFVAAAFRDRLEAEGQTVGRKVAIEALEFFDRHGVTIRRGDNRRINPHRFDLFEPARGKTQQEQGRESLPVERPDFKSGWGRETVSGGFDSHSLPPKSGMEA